MINNNIKEVTFGHNGKELTSYAVVHPLAADRYSEQEHKSNALRNHRQKLWEDQDRKDNPDKWTQLDEVRRHQELVAHNKKNGINPLFWFLLLF